jgi:amino acid permease
MGYKCFPVTIMLLIQYKKHVSPYLKAIIFTFISIGGELLFEWLDIYHTFEWQYYYGIPFYIVIYLIANYASKRKRFNEI